MIYLSGRISGLDREDYLSIFEHHEKKLGECVNPAKVMDGLPKMQHHEYMRIALTLLSMCDMIYLIPGWENSAGARSGSSRRSAEPLSWRQRSSSSSLA